MIGSKLFILTATRLCYRDTGKPVPPLRAPTAVAEPKQIEKTNAAPAAYLNNYVPNIHTAVVDGDTHKCTFSFVRFLKVDLKLVDVVRWKPREQLHQMQCWQQEETE